MIASIKHKAHAMFVMYFKIVYRHSSSYNKTCRKLCYQSQRYLNMYFVSATEDT